MAREGDVNCVEDLLSEKTLVEKKFMDDAYIEHRQKNRIMQKLAVGFRKNYLAILGILVVSYVVFSIGVLIFWPTLNYKKNIPGTTVAETVYEILTESFQDSSKFHNGFTIDGDGVGDIKGKYRFFF